MVVNPTAWLCCVCPCVQEAREAIQQEQAANGYTFDGVAHVQSCFAERRGTPRQGKLVPDARARIKFRASIPPASLECLDQFTHLWVIFVFHENTNVAKVGSKKASTFPAKIAPPRCVNSLAILILLVLG